MNNDNAKMLLGICRVPAQIQEKLKYFYSFDN